jgi:hypothetical protein
MRSLRAITVIAVILMSMSFMPNTMKSQTAPETVSFSIPLRTGWNSISIPVEQDVTAMPDVLDDIAGNWDIVQWFNPVEQDWKEYATFKPPPLRDLTHINWTMGIDIRITTACTLNGTGRPVTDPMPLYVDSTFNRVGYPVIVTDPDYTVADVKRDTNATEVYIMDNDFDPPVQTLLADNFVMQHQRAYWFNISENVSWYGAWTRAVFYNPMSTIPIREPTAIQPTEPTPEPAGISGGAVIGLGVVFLFFTFLVKSKLTLLIGVSLIGIGAIMNGWFI